MRLNDIVQGDHIVLEGVEAREAPNLAGALRRAVEATNQACASAEGPSPTASNVAEHEAVAIADQVRIGDAIDRCGPEAETPPDRALMFRSGAAMALSSISSARSGLLALGDRR
jgi:hypothetical protein